MDRHALAFRVRPGSEPAVAALLGDYDPPVLAVDGSTHLLATAVFMLGSLVVRAMEIEGDLGAVARHIASDPNVRRVESELHRHLERPYDLADPRGRQSFFRERLMRRLAHVEHAGADAPSIVHRVAVRYDLGDGGAEEAGRRLIASGPVPERVGASRVLNASLFAQGDDTLVRVIAGEGDVEERAGALAGSGARFRTILERDALSLGRA